MEQIFNNIINFIRKHKKPFIIATIVIVLGLIIFAVIEMTRNASLRISVTPISSTVTINGKEYHNGLYRFHPGTYTAIISNDGFDTKELSIELISNKTVDLSEYLTQGGNLDHYTSNKEDFIILQNIYNNDVYSQKPDELNKYFDNYKKIASIRERLPITEFVDAPENPSSKYAILIKEDPIICEHPVCLLVIDETGRLHEDALKIIKKHGFNPDDYPIRYSEKGSDF